MRDRYAEECTAEFVHIVAIINDRASETIVRAQQQCLDDIKAAHEEMLRRVESRYLRAREEEEREALAQAMKERVKSLEAELASIKDNEDIDREPDDSDPYALLPGEEFSPLHRTSYPGLVVGQCYAFCRGKETFLYVYCGCDGANEEFFVLSDGDEQIHIRTSDINEIRVIKEPKAP